MHPKIPSRLIPDFFSEMIPDFLSKNFFRPFLRRKKRKDLGINEISQAFLQW